MKNIPILPLTCIFLVLIGCSSHKAADGPSQNSKRIADIIITENSESLLLVIKGNRPLTYTAALQATPKGILIQFPDTGLELSRSEFLPPENEFIRIIKAAEIAENNMTMSSLLIGLKKNTPYDLVPGETGLEVVFPKTPALSKRINPKKEAAKTESQPGPVQINAPAATVLKTVTSKSLTDRLVIEVEADGTIKNYQTFTMKNPARIVFDFYQVKSPYRSEQSVAVGSKWVKRIRYFGHPDKLRLVLETSDAVLSNYASFPTQTGLFIQVGGVSANASQPLNALK